MHQEPPALTWPSPQWNTAWHKAIQVTRELETARRNPAANPPQQLEHQLEALIEALCNPTVGGLPISAVRMTCPGPGLPPHPTDKPTMRARLCAAATDTTGAHLVHQ